MTREQAYNYLKSSGMSDEQIKSVIDAFTCADCISREEVRRILGNEVFELMKLHTVNPEDNPKADAMSYGVNWSLNTLMELPSVTPQRPKGEWEYTGDYFTDGMCKCSECGIEVDVSEARNYCPNCGSYNGGGEDADSD